MAAAVAVVSPAMGRAQSCDEVLAPSYFKPLTDGDGLRYPITIGPLSWRLIGRRNSASEGLGWADASGVHALVHEFVEPTGDAEVD
jgi:hypothetical protein